MQIIFGHKWRHLKGERDMWERYGGVDITLDPCSFGQANTLVCALKLPILMYNFTKYTMLNFKKNILTIQLAASYSIPPSTCATCFLACSSKDLKCV